MPKSEVPRWAELAAWATVGCTIPSCVWRIAAGFGVDVGFTGELGKLYHGPVFVTYVWILTLAAQGAALLTLGLVRPWGERIPTWIPVVGGRRVHPLVAIVPATLGGLAVTALCATVALSPRGPLNHPDFPHGTADMIMRLCYAPLLAWGPLVLAVTAAYAYRRGTHTEDQPPELI